MKRKGFFGNIRNLIDSVVSKILEIPKSINRTPERNAPQKQIIETSVTKTAEGLIPDVSTRAIIQNVEDELSSSRRAKDIAHELGISTQKWVSIREKIRAGDLYGIDLQEKLQEAQENFTHNTQRLVEVNYVITDSEGRHHNGNSTVMYFPSRELLKEKLPFSRDSGKRFFTFSDAANWWAQTGGAQEYFSIVSLGKGEFTIYDMRDATEYAKRGELNGVIRANKILAGTQNGNLNEEDQDEEDQE